MDYWRALERRINAKLRLEGLYLQSCGYRSFWYPTLGDYYILNQRNGIEATHVNIELLGRKLGCLEPADQQIELDFG